MKWFTQRRRPFVMTVLTALLTAAGIPASAQNRLGAHLGFALPLAAITDGRRTTIADDAVMVFPMGIEVHRSERLTFSLELAPIVQNAPQHVDLLLHPGVVWNLGGGYAVGNRVAFVVGTSTWGITPLFNRRLAQVGQGATLFGEIDLPVRFSRTAAGRSSSSVGLAVVMGIGF